MSLTSYRAAPPRDRAIGDRCRPRIAGTKIEEEASVLCRPGDDLLSRVLRQSTIGAEAFDGRVRDGIGSDRLAKATRPAKDGVEAKLGLGVLGATALTGGSCRER